MIAEETELKKQSMWSLRAIAACLASLNTHPSQASQVSSKALEQDRACPYWMFGIIASDITAPFATRLCQATLADCAGKMAFICAWTAPTPAPAPAPAPSMSPRRRIVSLAQRVVAPLMRFHFPKYHDATRIGQHARNDARGWG
jgi:hypothetical protein